MKKRVVAFSSALILILSISLNNSSAQESYKPGYIIKINGDTVHGYINYLNWDKNPKMVCFKNTVSDNSVIYTPLLIKSFFVSNEYYVSAIVTTDNSPFKTSELLDTNKAIYSKDTAFLMTLVSGNATLYFLKKNDNKPHFYISKDTIHCKELIYRRYTRVQKDFQGEATNIVENKLYIGQLHYYLNDCPALQSSIDELSYDIESMSDLFVDYDRCNNGIIHYKKTSDTAYVGFGALGSFYIDHLKFNDSYSNYLTQTSFLNYASGTAGLYLEWGPGRNNHTFTVYNDILFTYVHAQGTDNQTFEYAPGLSTYSYVQSTFDLAYLRLTTMIRVNFHSNHRVKPYLNLGIGNALLLGYKNSEAAPTNIQRGLQLITNERLYEQSYVIGAGIRYEHLTAELRFEKSNGFSSYSYLGSNINYYYVIIGYIFFENQTR